MKKYMILAWLLGNCMAVSFPTTADAKGPGMTFDEPELPPGYM
jgi:hypothetical protein